MAERTVTIPVPIIATVTIEATGEFDWQQLYAYLHAAARELCTEAVDRVYLGKELIRESEVLHRLHQISGVCEVDLHPSNIFELRPVPNLEPTVEIGSEPHQVREGTMPDVDYHSYREWQMSGKELSPDGVLLRVTEEAACTHPNAQLHGGGQHEFDWCPDCGAIQGPGPVDEDPWRSPRPPAAGPKAWAAPKTWHVSATVPRGESETTCSEVTGTMKDAEQELWHLLDSLGVETAIHEEGDE